MTKMNVMNDLISRQAALDIIDSELNVWLTDEEWLRIEALGMLIEDLPAISPVKHGKWELVDEAEPMRYGCSECKKLSYTQDNYCSYCGAAMVKK